MSVNLLIILAFLYAGTGIVSIVGYFPTIRDLFKKKKSANADSYIIWTLCEGMALLYVLFAVKDILLELVIGANFACCAIILILAENLKYKTSHRFR